MNYNLFLDDEREPWMAGNYVYPVELRSQYRLEEWVIARNYLEFVQCIERNGLPTKISFDHDLGDTVLHKATNEDGVTDYDAIEFTPPLQKTGYHCVKWLCDYCLEYNLKLPQTYVHSANPVGAENMKKYLENFKKHFEQKP